MTHHSNAISVFYYNTIMWHHSYPMTCIMWQVWHRWVTLFRFFKENFRDSKSVKISVFVVWSECQFNVRNVYFEKSKFSKKKIKNSDTKSWKKNLSKSLFVYHHQINNLQLNFNLELTHVFRNFKLQNYIFHENRFSNT